MPVRVSYLLSLIWFGTKVEIMGHSVKIKPAL